jgi:histidinol-phosphate aminotransferase
MIFSPTYGMYEVAASMNDIAVIDVPLLPDFSIDIHNAEKHLNDPFLKLMFICSPNNPTGNCFRDNDIMYLIKNFQGIVIIDEAYIDFAGRTSYISLTAEYQNLIVMQTFSKAMGLASVRVGACYSNSAIVKYLFRMKPPYNISTLNQETALKRLKESYATRQEVTMIRNEREKLSVSLKKVKTVKRVYPSEANFILAEVTDPDRIYNLLVDEGIIVRNRNSVVRGCLRITVGTPSENERLIDALNRIDL